MKAILLSALIFCSISLSAQTNSPNIIFIISDDHAYQAISAYGNKFMSTPNIDRIAHDGVLLTNNCVGNSLCGPSRATLLTGKFSHKNGYALNGREPFDVTQFVFPQLLQQNGYQTAWIGKMHLNSLPNGFDYLKILNGQGTYYNPQFISKTDTAQYHGYVTDLISGFFFDWLKNRDEHKPFFAVVGEKATHREWLPDIQDLGAYDDIDFPLPESFFDNYDTRLAAKDQDMTIDKTMRLKEDLKVHQGFGQGAGYDEYSRMDEAQKKAFKDYYGKITKEFDEKKLSGKDLVKWKYERYLKDYYATAKSMDRNIGKILDYLDSTGLSKNTVVIYASDQGFYMGEHGWFDKRFIYDESLKTAFMIKYPGVIQPGWKLDSLVSNIDWAPTVLDIAGLKAPAEVQGRSFYPLLKKEAVADWPDAEYYHYYEYPQPHHVSPHFGIRTKNYMLVRFYKGVNSWELFDLKKDPEELTNVYGNSAYKSIQGSLVEKLKGLIIKYDDKEALELFNTPVK
ncbi:sulfatase [Parafilimonas sp.]|uniref:sulfatase family protein n=1 Tax=Parafilimonas sp. TaxID=1969739 RepID=UPI0039E3EC5C